LGNLHSIDRILDGKKYRSILEQNLKQSASRMEIEEDFIMLQDNDPKHPQKSPKNT